MLQDPNVERYVKENLKPLQYQIDSLKKLIKKLQRDVIVLKVNKK